MENNRFPGEIFIMSLPAPHDVKLDGRFKKWHFSYEKITEEIRGALDLSDEEEYNSDNLILHQIDGKYTLIYGRAGGFGSDISLVERELTPQDVNLLFGLQMRPHDLIVDYRIEATTGKWDEKSHSLTDPKPVVLNIEQCRQHVLDDFADRLKKILNENHFHGQVHLAITEIKKECHLRVTLQFNDPRVAYEELKGKCVKCREKDQGSSLTCRGCSLDWGDADRFHKELHDLLRKTVDPHHPACEMPSEIRFIIELLLDEDVSEPERSMSEDLEKVSEMSEPERSMSEDLEKVVDVKLTLLRKEHAARCEKFVTDDNSLLFPWPKLRKKEVGPRYAQQRGFIKKDGNPGSPPVIQSLPLPPPSPSRGFPAPFY
jgi:hypothetical protein